MDYLLDALINEIESNLTLFSTITIGALPPRNGISMIIGSGATQSTYMDKGTYNAIYATINAKHTDQQTAAMTLDEIHLFLSRLKRYPSGSGAQETKWQIVNIIASSLPTFIVQEKDGYIYGSIIKINYYIGG